MTLLLRLLGTWSSRVAAEILPALMVFSKWKGAGLVSIGLVAGSPIIGENIVLRCGAAGSQGPGTFSRKHPSAGMDSVKSSLLRREREARYKETT